MGAQREALCKDDGGDETGNGEEEESWAEESIESRLCS